MEGKCRCSECWYGWPELQCENFAEFHCCSHHVQYIDDAVLNLLQAGRDGWQSTLLMIKWAVVCIGSWSRWLCTSSWRSHHRQKRKRRQTTRLWRRPVKRHRNRLQNQLRIECHHLLPGLSPCSRHVTDKMHFSVSHEDSKGSERWKTLDFVVFSRPNKYWCSVKSPKLKLSIL